MRSDMMEPVSIELFTQEEQSPDTEKEKQKEIMERFGAASVRIRKKILEAGFLESGIILTKDLKYHEDVRKLCEGNQCRSYGTTWACPPAVGTMQECRERVELYTHMQLFSRAYVIKSMRNINILLASMHDFKNCAILLDESLRPLFADYRILSNESCDRCKTCTYPSSPCRFPDNLHHSIEGYGFYVLELARQAGIKYIHGPKTATFFGAVLYRG